MVKDLAGNSATSSSTVTVEVIIPEFHTWIMLATLVIMTLTAAALLRKNTKI